MRRNSSSWLGILAKLGLRRAKQNHRARRPLPGTTTSSRVLCTERLEDRSMLAVLTVNVTTDTSLNDANTDLSLREAIQVVNNGSLTGLSVGTERGRVTGTLGSNDTIQFTSGLSGTIGLSLGELMITRPVTIIGPGGNILTIDATPNDSTPTSNLGDGSRVFNISIGSGTVDLRGLRITGGDVSGDGGAIFSSGGNLIVRDSTVTGNFATNHGGGISSYGTLEIISSTISSNGVTSNYYGTGGGGINFSGTTMSVTGSTISGNTVNHQGGGVLSSYAGTITFTNTNITGNQVLGTPYYGGTGGGVFVSGASSFKVTGGSISNNSAVDGGGLNLSVFGSQPNSGIELMSAVISGNTASNSGGGLLINTSNVFKVVNSVITNNTASAGNGGGLNLSLAGGMEFSATTVSNNVASNGDGGGMYLIENGSSNHSSIISGSTFSNNSALAIDGLGGGLFSVRNGTYYNPLAPLSISNSTFSGNTAHQQGGGVYLGSAGASTLITNATITANKSPDGAGLRSNDNVVLTNTIVSGNRLVASSTPNNISGNVAGTYNFVGTGGNGGLVNGISGNIVGVDNPQIGALANNGGLTLSHLPTGASPVRNAGSPAFQYSPSDLDQRLGQRVLDGRIDIGAVETAGAIVPPAQSAGMADIVLLIDESGSSTQSESGWLANMLVGLEAELVQRGFTSNRYGIVGFANRQLSGEFAYSYLVGGQLFGDAQDAIATTGMLVHTGGTEDGWDSLEHAVAEYDYRPGAAVHFIFLSDEPRNNLNTSLTPDDNVGTPSISEQLLPTAIRPVIDARNATFTAVVTATFTPDNSGDTVLGALSAPNPLGPIHNSKEFDSATNSVRSGTTVDETSDVLGVDQSTLDPYVRLAWATGGSAWDDQVIRGSALASPIVSALTREFGIAVSNRIIEQVATREIILPTKLVVGIDFGGSVSSLFPNAEPTEAIDPDPLTPGNQSAILTVPGPTIIDNNSNSIPSGTEFAFRNARAANDGKNFNLKFGAAQGITNGKYLVELFFAEIGNTDRIFDVALEGNTVLNDYSIAADFAKVEPIGGDTDGRIEVSTAGTNTAFVKTFEVTVIDGQLNIDLTDVGGAEGPLLSALRILRELTVPQVTDVVVGRSSGPAYDFAVPGRVGSGEQLRTVPIGGINQISITFSENVGYSPAAQAVVQNAFRLHNEATDQDITIPFTFGWNSTTRTGTWTFNQALPPGPYVAVIGDSVVNADLVALDGNWINPAKLIQLGTDTFPSGDGDQGDYFEFYFSNLPADFNHDNLVDGTDLNIWKANYGRSVGVTQSDGDVNGDGSVDGSDFLKWQTQVGFDLRDWNTNGILMPTVTNVIVAGSSTQHAPYSFAPAMASGTHQLTTIPLAGANSITLEFDEDVSVGADDLNIADLNDSNRIFTRTGFTTTARSATWTFAEDFSAGAIQVSLSSNVTDATVSLNGLDGAWKNETNVAQTDADAFKSGDGSQRDAFHFNLTSLPADFNHDNIVNGADQQIWSANFGIGTGATQSMGDTDGDGDVDGADFLEWQRELYMVIDWQDWSAAGLVAAPAGPLTLRVSTLVDENDGNISPGDVSLREALALAAQYDGADIIEFDPSLAGGTITLQNSLDRLIVDSDVEIRGLGSNQLTVNGGGAGYHQGVFLVDSGVVATIRDLKITGAAAVPGPPGTVGPFNGGGIHNSGNLTLNHVIITGNIGLLGGGIAQETAGAVLTVIDSTIDGNTGYSPGGGVYASAGTVSIVSSTISNNSSMMGAGIYIQNTAAVTLSNSTLSGNQNEAIRIAGTTSSLMVLNSTISNNTQSNSFPATITAGGVNSSGTNVTIVNSILAGNTGGDIYGTVNGLSHHNLVGNGSEGTLVNGTNSNLVGTSSSPINAYLGALANNGGPTQTHLPLANSPASNAGDNTAASSLSIDQRGKTRLRGQYIDIGSVETSFVVSTLVDESDGNYAANDLSLREAIALAAATPGSDLVEFDETLTSAGPATITLSYDGPDSGTVPDPLSLASNVVIDGPAANLLSISGNNLTRVFEVNSGVNATIKDLRITGGSASTGAGVYSVGALTLSGVEIDSNSAASMGGGIHVAGGTLTLSNSTLSNNFAYGAGGGIYLGTTSAAALIVNTTISANSANYVGGGVYDGSSGANIVNSTVTANSTWYSGAGIYGSYGTKLTNSIVAANAGNKDIEGNFNANSSYNLIGFDSNLSNAINNAVNHNQVGGQSGAPAIDARLTALGYYGGTTKTHALKSGSSAIDSGDNSVLAAYDLAFDQRGPSYRRLVDWDEDFNARIDIGAFEVALLEVFT